SQSTTSPPPPPDATQITLVEYNSAGAQQQSFDIPIASGQADAGAFVGGPQINFGNANNQIVYVSTAYTNNATPTGFIPGNVKVDFSGGSPAVTGTGLGLPTTVGGRGIAPTDCRVYESYNPGIDRFLEPLSTVANYQATGNIRLLEAFNGNLYASSGSSGFGIGISLVSTTTAEPPPAPSLVIPMGPSPLGFAFGDANTCYITHTTAVFGVHKWTFAGTWTDQGFNTVIGGGSVI